MSDQAAAAVAHAHIELTRFFVAIREAFESFAVAARKVVEGMGELVREFRAWTKLMRRRVLWLDRGRPAPLRIDGHAYRRRLRRRR